MKVFNYRFRVFFTIADNTRVMDLDFNCKNLRSLYNILSERFDNSYNIIQILPVATNLI